MKTVLVCVCFVFFLSETFGQLVRRVDYDAAFALQAGGNTGVLLPPGNTGMCIQPWGGLKMTFPFTRKWFLGMEINYGQLKFRRSNKTDDNQGKLKLNADLQQLEFPVYLKYMLNCNKASVLFGFYGNYIQDASSVPVNRWNGGVTLGYEHRIVKHLNIMCRMDAGVRDLMPREYVRNKHQIPVSVCLGISYDIFRIGDCECD